MKIKSSTIALLAIALLLAGGIYVWDRSRSEQSQTTDAQKAGKSLFALKETDITQLTIQSKNQTLKLEKTGKAWKLTAPKAGPADEGTVTFLLNLLATGTSERTLQAEPAQLEEFGLDRPAATVSLQLQNQTTHRLVLGKQTFNQSAVYAQVDPGVAAKKADVVLIPTGFLDAIDRPLAEWQAKPASPKPSPLPKPKQP
ncbi:DUF4340 domain-containing protein [Altericista sp. CCNU0014]|uniref:DUF4340 domain-containing protein n=1 Tax=Altericista sp. CCNU0014 TaxID=3082949 RepID=UPI00384DFCAB